MWTKIFISLKISKFVQMLTSILCILLPDKDQKVSLEDIVFELLIKPGIANAKATNDEKNKINGIDTQPNQKPIADKSFASLIPYLLYFLIL